MYHKERILLNETAEGSILETDTQEFESQKLAGQIPRHYADLADAYESEIRYIESEIERMLRSFTVTESK